ncbi:MAG: hypothetical protein VYA34_00390 [Myxococcota bacterium]|nr:hypothetical protein [Myxococcota bacterium]
MEVSFMQAKGEFVLLFCDDDALVPDALEKAHKILTAHDADILTFQREGLYYFDNWHDDAVKNTLVIPGFTGKVYEEDSHAHLASMFEVIELLPSTPMNTNAFYRTRLVQGLIHKFETIYPHGHMGDYNIACYSLSHVEKFLFLDEPLAIFGQWRENTSQQLHDLQTTMPEYQEWVDWARDELLSSMPIPFYLWPNCVAASLMRVQEQLELPYTVRSSIYFTQMQEELANLARKGIDVSEQQEQFAQLFQAQPRELQENVKNIIQNGLRRQHARQTAEVSVPDLNEHLAGVEFEQPQHLLMPGSEHGFKNLGESLNALVEFSWADYKKEQASQDTKDTEVSFSRESFLKVLQDTVDQQSKTIVVVGSGNLARVCARSLNGRVAHVVEPRVALSGTEFLEGLFLEGMNVLQTGNYDCVLLACDGGGANLSRGVKEWVKRGKSPDATIVDADEVVRLAC